MKQIIVIENGQAQVWHPQVKELVNRPMRGALTCDAHDAAVVMKALDELEAMKSQMALAQRLMEGRIAHLEGELEFHKGLGEKSKSAEVALPHKSAAFRLAAQVAAFRDALDMLLNTEEVAEATPISKGGTGG